MQRAIVMLLFSVGALHAAADDAVPSAGDHDRLAATAKFTDSLHRVPGYPRRWQLSHPLETTPFSNDASPVIANIEFQDPGALARVKKVRELSLLTLAEVGRTRLFLGVSQKGLLGFHLGSLPRVGDERCLELARMPYLKSDHREQRAE